MSDLTEKLVINAVLAPIAGTPDPRTLEMTRNRVTHRRGASDLSRSASHEPVKSSPPTVSAQYLLNSSVAPGSPSLKSLLISSDRPSQ